MPAPRSVMGSPFASVGVSAPGAAQDDVNPMEAVANLADCMLVLVCGLFLALVLRFNLNITQESTEVVADEDMTEISQAIEDEITSMAERGSGYEELGVVYEDPASGKMYLIKNKAKDATDNGK